MSKIVLDQSQVIPLIGQVKPTGMPEHMGVDRTELALREGTCDST